MHYARFFIPVLLLSLPGVAFASPASAESFLVTPSITQQVNVNVGFNTQVPISDLSQDALAATQRAGREYLYSSARGECSILQATIAETCRLTGLNINTQIQQHGQPQPLLYINGNASFAITLKDESKSGN